MLIIELVLLLCLSFVRSHRYYAFVETLFVIDRNYFPPPSEISYEDYVKVIVDTANIVNGGVGSSREIYVL